MFQSLFPMQRRILGLTILFLLIGQIALFSATAVMGIQKHSSEFYYVLRQSACGLIGLLLMIGVSKIPYSQWKKISYWLILAQIFLIALTHFGPFRHYAYGATRWLKIGPVLFQPSELAKITLTIFFASLLARHKESPLPAKKWVTNSLPIVITLALIFKQPDLGTTTLLVVMIIGMLFIAGVRISYLISFLGVGSLGFVFAIVHYAWRRKRLFAYLNPWADPQGTGFQTIQSFLSFHSGKLFGTGLGNGNSKLFFLPEVHTDFIFALIGEETGFLGAISLLILFTYFCYLLFKIALTAKDAFGCYLSFGLSLSIALQIAVNLGGVTGLLPVKGLPLPFISWGRSALIVNLVLMGILLNILQSSSIIPSENPLDPKNKES
ncbi:putative lipid II flippase FtsW [bacterium]|nr:putative lipid II flippase FtsW [bacterium]